MLSWGGSSSSSAAAPNVARRLPNRQPQNVAGMSSSGAVASEDSEDAGEEELFGEELVEVPQESEEEPEPGDMLVAAAGPESAVCVQPVAERKYYHQHAPYFKRQIVSYPWRSVQDVPSWSQRARSLMQELAGKPPKENLAKEEHAADVDAREVRLKTISEIAEGFIQNRLTEEGFDDEDPEPVSAKRKKAAAPKQQKRLRVGRDDIDAVAPILTAEEIARQRNDSSCSQTAALLQDPPRLRDWTIANKSKEIVHVLDNAVLGSPHKRALHRIVARYSGQHFCDETADHECTPPDLTKVPEEVIRVRPEEVIISVVVCNTAGHKVQAYDILASQTLYDLRDSFYFASDWMYDGPTRLGSACMFIDGVFYNDMRHKQALDYSKDLIDWIKVTGNRVLKENPSRKMDVRLCDLGHIPFGEKCLYMRNGYDEHFMYFTGARLYDAKSDCPLVQAYPCLTYMRVYNKRRCVACLQHPAIWVVLDSSRCPINPGFWCEICFRHFFQDKDGNYIPPVDYKFFPYLHDE